ncbi:MAG: OPT/YSL family transporter [Myxococcales bacterium]|nr:OPT/YSL family transporter [Myxococcales bacterium]MCB9568139.1 OPT/YSL family transporter [Myxococcales bacterium]MCB9705367.1 OPT/YSL family transporter [Myxococcales bacterium]
MPPNVAETPATDARGRPIRRGPYPELTWTALIVGYLLGALICVSIGYASLILGFSIEGSELAAILGWGILRGILRRSSIVENNINQTIASAVNGASAGMMFSVPALFILDKSYPGAGDFSPLLMVLACITGGILGLAFVIPLRKQMIDFNRLAYPGGIAVAAVLRSSGTGAGKAVLLLGGALVSGVVHYLVGHFQPSETWAMGDQIGAPSYLNLTFYLSLLTVGTGFLSGRGGLYFGLGGFICYFALAPMLAAGGSPEILAIMGQGPDVLREDLFRPLGIGILIGAAVGGIIAAFPLIRSAVRSMQDAAKARAEGGGQADELSINVLYGSIAAGALALVAIAFLSTADMTIGHALGMALLGTLWIWAAGVIVSECLGRTNWSPLSGMTLIAVTILILVASGLGSVSMIVSSVVVGAAICVAIAQAGDMMLDLKSGYLVGASPRKQQIAQMLATWLGPILVMGLIYVLHQAYGIGSARLPAAQATALAGVVEGIIGGDVPAFRYAAGAGIGGLMAMSGLGGIGVLIGLGFYMPFHIVLTYTVGCLGRMVIERVRGRGFVEDVGIPVAAGLIVGEALVGVGKAMVAVIAGAAGGH